MVDLPITPKLSMNWVPMAIQATYPLMPYVVICYAMYLAPPEIVKQAWMALLVAGAALIDPKSPTRGGTGNAQ